MPSHLAEVRANNFLSPFTSRAARGQLCFCVSESVHSILSSSPSSPPFLPCIVAQEKENRGSTMASPTVDKYTADLNRSYHQRVRPRPPNIFSNRCKFR
jgi:hypothetical protein